MGQKVNPHGLRVGVIKDWDSRWYADAEYSDFLVEDYNIRKFLKKKLYSAGVSKIEIERASDRVKVILYTAKPGVVIGKGGAEIEVTKKELSKLTDKKVLVDIKEIKRPDRDAQLVAENIAQQLEKVRTPVILVMNKVDQVKREELLPCIAKYKDIYHFAEIVPVCARTGENTDELVRVILQYLPYGPRFYDEDTVTDQPERQIVSELIREKALHSLNEEIPHGIAVVIDRMKFRKGQKGTIADIDATIICERDSHKGIIIGKQGSMLKKIGSTARFEIERMLDCQVNLKLWVKVKKDWRDSEFLMRNFGYREEE